jgi:hypothetical protein
MEGSNVDLVSSSHGVQRQHGVPAPSSVAVRTLTRSTAAQSAKDHGDIIGIDLGKLYIGVHVPQNMDTQASASLGVIAQTQEGWIINTLCFHAFDRHHELVCGYYGGPHAACD